MREMFNKMMIVIAGMVGQIRPCAGVGCGCLLRVKTSRPPSPQYDPWQLQEYLFSKDRAA